MYQRIIRPLLFLFPPEWVHRTVVLLLRVLFAIPGVPHLFRKHYCIRQPELARTLFGIRFPNPVGIAAGFDKEAGIYNHLAHFGFGHIEIGTVTPRPQSGNPKPRLFRLPKDKALINRMGFNNHGIEHFVAKLKKNKARVIIGGNIGKNTDTPNELAVRDYCLCFEKLFDLVDYFVVNVSCPNIRDMHQLQNKDSLTEILRAIQDINLKKDRKKPVLLKIAPDLTHSQLDEVIEIVQATRLDGIVATNTSTGRDHLESSKERVTRIGDGGLSGRPIREQSTRTIAYLHEQSKGTIPIIGVGGILDPAGAMEKLNAGASLVQLYTGFIYSGPAIAKRINKTLLQQS